MVRGLEHLCHERSLWEVRCLEKRHLQADLIIAFQYLKEGNLRKMEFFFMRICSDRRSNGFKL